MHDDDYFSPAPSNWRPTAAKPAKAARSALSSCATARSLPKAGTAWSPATTRQPTPKLAPSRCLYRKRPLSSARLHPLRLQRTLPDVPVGRLLARIDASSLPTAAAEAAAIGFCDDELYSELNRHFNERSIVMEHRPMPAPWPLEHWSGNPARVALLTTANRCSLPPFPSRGNIAGAAPDHQRTHPDAERRR